LCIKRGPGSVASNVRGAPVCDGRTVVQALGWIFTSPAMRSASASPLIAPVLWITCPLRVLTGTFSGSGNSVMTTRWGFVSTSTAGAGGSGAFSSFRQPLPILWMTKPSSVGSVSAFAASRLHFTHMFRICIFVASVSEGYPTMG